MSSNTYMRNLFRKNAVYDNIIKSSNRDIKKVSKIEINSQ